MQVYDVSSSDNANFIVMELIDGITLKQYMAERVGFEPTDAFTSPVFKTGSFNRSDISPFGVPEHF